MKHISIDMHLVVCDLVQPGKIKVQQLNTTDELVNCPTKPHSKSHHQYFQNKFGVSNNTPI